MLYLQRAV